MPGEKGLDTMQLVEKYICILSAIKVWHLQSYMAIKILLDNATRILRSIWKALFRRVNSIHVLSFEMYHLMLELVGRFTNRYIIKLLQRRDYIRSFPSWSGRLMGFSLCRHIHCKDKQCLISTNWFCMLLISWCIPSIRDGNLDSKWPNSLLVPSISKTYSSTLA